MCRRTEELIAELKAILCWERDYHRPDSQDFIQTSSRKARQQRLVEILKELGVSDQCAPGTLGSKSKTFIGTK